MTRTRLVPPIRLTARSSSATDPPGAASLSAREAPASANPALYVGGFVAATAALHVLGLGIGKVIHDRRTVRVGMGAATIAAGALLLTV